MAKFKIDKTVFEMFPDTHIGVIIAKNLKNDQRNDSIQFVLHESEKQVLEHYGGRPLLDLPEIKDWRQAYRQFGAKKSRRVSVEAVLKRVLKGDELPLINPLVDLYNAVSLRHVFPCGGEDLDTIVGDVQLTFAQGDEYFKTIGSEVNEPPMPGEVVYKDGKGCLCRCWNWREADRTKLTPKTQNAILVIETLNRHRKNELDEAMKHLAKLAEELLDASIRTEILHKACPEIEI